MSIIALIVVIVLAVIILWAINSYLPDQPPLRLILNLLVIVVLIIIMLSIAGVIPDLNRPLTR
jgi:heme A synthase